MCASFIRPWVEHRFWVEILQDHAYFMRDHLAAPEAGHIRTAQAYIDAFQSLIRRLDAIPRDSAVNGPALIAFSREALPVADGYFRFEGGLQRLRIANQVNLNLSPTYLNGTLNENEEYLRILSFTAAGAEPQPLPLVDLMDLWLEDQLGHAILLSNVLDPAEFGLRETTDRHAQGFRVLFTQNEIVRGYLRFTPSNFPVQLRLARETLAAVEAFYRFVVRVIALYRGTELLDRTTLRFLEHHLPESCYFMRKLAAFIPGAAAPEPCPLTKPSFADNVQLPADPPVI